MELTEPILESKLPRRRTMPAPPVVEEDQEPKARRGRPLPALARKTSEMAAQVVQMAIKEEQKTARDHERVRCLCQIVFSGAFSTMLKNSTLLSPEDKEFLKDLGYL